MWTCDKCAPRLVLLLLEGEHRESTPSSLGTLENTQDDYLCCEACGSARDPRTLTEQEAPTTDARGDGATTTGVSTAGRGTEEADSTTTTTTTTTAKEEKKKKKKKHGDDDDDANDEEAAPCWTKRRRVESSAPTATSVLSSRGCRSAAWGRDALPVCAAGDHARCRELLVEHGCVVFRGCASRAELKEAERLFWDWLEEAAPRVRRAETATLTTEALDGLGYANTGVVNKRGIHHSAFMWHLRLLPGVLAAWRTVWDLSTAAEEDRGLVSSFDGCGMWRNPLHPDLKGQRGVRTQGEWYHLDQNAASEPRFQGFQGLVNLYAADATSGSTVVVPGSHRDFAVNCARGNKRGTSSFVKLHAPGDLAYCRARAVQVAPLDAGDVVIWDSRVVHCSAGVATGARPRALLGLRQAPSQPPLARLVAYVAMMPRGRVLAAAAAKRKDAAKRGLPTGHNPLVIRNHGPNGQSRAPHRCPPPNDPRWRLI